MNEVPQMASAVLALAFAAVMLVAGQLFIEYRSTNNAFEPAVVRPTKQANNGHYQADPVGALTGQEP
jgi:hypothetical protein